MNLGEDALSRRPGSDDLPAVSLEQDATLTYGQLRRLRDQIAIGLLERGVRPGDRVGVLMFNAPEYWAAYLAVAKIGAICVRLNFRLAPAELSYAINDSSCCLLLLHDALCNQVEPTLGDTSVQHYFSFDYAGAPNPSWAQPSSMLLGSSPSRVLQPSATDPSAPVMIMYTSGTTGRPKGVVWTHRNSLIYGLIQNLQWSFSRSTVAMTSGPLYHVGSLENLLLPTLMAGGHAILTKSGGFSLERVLDVIQARRVTDLLLFPAMIHELLEKELYKSFDLSSVKTLVTGGSPMLPWAVHKLSRVLPGASLYPAYGLTEGGSISSILDPSELAENPTAAGRPIPLVEIDIWDEEGRSLGPDQPGEICVRGPNTSAQYWNRPEATAEVYRDGWVRTGDLGKRSVDGMLSVTGRIKDMIRSGDENVYASEVEAVIASRPEVYEAAVIGVPDREFGEAVCAVVVLREGAELSPEDLIAYCRQQLASYKKPRHVVYVDSLPRNITGKVLKYVLRDTYARLGTTATDASRSA